MKRLFLLPALLLFAFSLQAISKTGSLAGHVTDSSGKPIIGATIRIRGTKQGGISKAPSGHFLIINIPSGTYTIETTAPGFYRDTTTINIYEDSTAWISRELTYGNETAKRIMVSPGYSGVFSGGVNGFSIRSGRSGSAQGNFRTLSNRGLAIIHDTAHNDSSPRNYDSLIENRFVSPRKELFSTFSIDVDAASYTNIRRYITAGSQPPRDAVRIEEMINYFHYDLPEPSGGAPFSITTEIANCPWNLSHRLVRIGLQGRHIPMENLPPSNLVFLVDVSGSMESEERLPLIRSSLKMLVDHLRDQDRVAIVTYAGNAGLVLASTPGSNKAIIDSAIDRMEAGGSTDGGAGILLAYDVARQNFIKDGNNRVILATDGDFNVGVSSEHDLDSLIEDQRKDGVYLTALGVGTDNFKDGPMEQLADHGNGNYYYLDGIDEARRVLIGQLAGTLFTIAKDVKIQVEFNPEKVESYRLIGYESRMLATEDFTDDHKDAGELGAGHTVTAVYEIVPGRAAIQKGGGMDLSSIGDAVGTLPPGTPGLDEDDMMAVRLRYKLPADSVSLLVSQPVRNTMASLESASADLKFIAAVVEFGLVLRNSEFKGSATIEEALGLARSGIGADADGYRADFIAMLENTTPRRAGIESSMTESRR